MNDTLFCLAFMQHHGAPTRLLDGTYSPFIAAQFAVKDGQAWGDDGKRIPQVIWCFRAEWLEKQAASKVGCDKVQARNDDKKRNDARFYELYKNDQKFVLHDNPLRLNERLSIQQGIFLCPATIASSFLTNLKANSKDNIRKIVLDLETKNLIQFARI